MGRKRVVHEPRDRSLEAEMKFRLGGQGDHAQLRARLRALGAKDEGAYDEDNLRFRRPGKQPASLRLRLIDGGREAILTTKGPARYLRGIKIREETEVGVTDGHAARDLLESLGYVVAYTYRKHRDSWRLDDVTVALDTLDFGFFVEIEGPKEILEKRATELGLEAKQAIRSSYSELARRHLGTANLTRA